MSADRQRQPVPATEPARPAPQGSGEGATTALEALIRQRKMGQSSDEQGAASPPTPAQDAC